MTIEAVVTTLGTVLLLSGGLVVSILRLRRYPEVSLDSDEPGAEQPPSRAGEPPHRDAGGRRHTKPGSGPDPTRAAPTPSGGTTRPAELAAHHHCQPRSYS